jgi:hypothetical protein
MPSPLKLFGLRASTPGKPGHNTADKREYPRLAQWRGGNASASLEGTAGSGYEDAFELEAEIVRSTTTAQGLHFVTS